MMGKKTIFYYSNADQNAWLANEDGEILQEWDGEDFAPDLDECSFGGPYNSYGGATTIVNVDNGMEWTVEEFLYEEDDTLIYGPQGEH